MNQAKIKKKGRWMLLVRGLIIIIGGFITAYGLEAVLIPNNVSDGGVTGLSIVGSEWTGIQLGILIALLNIPFIYLGYKQIGTNFAVFSTIGIASLDKYKLNASYSNDYRRRYFTCNRCWRDYYWNRNGVSASEWWGIGRD